MSDYKREEHEVDAVEEQEIKERKRDLNADPITGEPGAHPVGVGTGGAAGAATGAAIGGLVGGPVGATVGGVIGAVAGGLAGKAAGEAIDPTVEDAYWREHYKSRPYYKQGRSYEDYEGSYRYGWEAAARPEYADRDFEDVESELETNWPSYRGSSTSEWNDSREAAQDAYSRVRQNKNR